jgi:cell division protein FtsZ
MSEMGKAMMGTGLASGEDRATKAAEMAIRSPLLEDVDLAGARGILVNITSGPDFTLGEFDQVGSVVNEISDDNANVVVGTVIDPEMSDEISVTVVATGLGGAQASPQTVVDNGQAIRQPRRQYNPSEADAPQVLRTQAVGNTALAAEPQSTPTQDGEMEKILNIPAFLRRQAD